ncbi:uncharacterized protein LOC106661459 isoform X2 [Cimex lectularius]|uniref:Uncharacterized protein n=1 Tax=Cimex lectularius TaxID=79782 RepID=A0A8I6R889_CIMLE|nr:uncharacterized protein LOC106661459 isoform X2 [Cimex lectularius]
MAEQQQKKLMVQVFFEGKNKKKIIQNFEFVVIEDGNNPGITVRPVHTERDSELEDVDMRLVIDNEYNPVSAQVLDRENVMTKSNNAGGKGSRDDLFNDAINKKKTNENKQPESSSSHKPKERTAGTSKKPENTGNPKQVSRLIVSKPKNTLGPSNSKEKKSNVENQPAESGQQQMQYEDRECEKLKHRRNSQHQEAFLIQTEHFADEESLSRSRKEHSESEFALIRPVSVDNPRSLSKSPNRQFRRQCLSPSSHESIQGEPTEDQVHTSKKPHEEHKSHQADEDQLDQSPHGQKPVIIHEQNAIPDEEFNMDKNPGEPSQQQPVKIKNVLLAELKIVSKASVDKDCTNNSIVQTYVSEKKE